MCVIRRIAAVILLASLSWDPVSGYAQDDAGTRNNGDLQVSTGISIGLSGAKVFSKFELKNELGMSYDVMSLLQNESVRDSINLTTEQFANISGLHDAITNELMSNVAGAVLSDDGKSAIEKRFADLEDELRSLMNPQQVLQLEQAKNQIAIRRFGLSEVMATNQWKDELGLSDENLNRLSHRQDEFSLERDNRIKTLIHGANQALIEQLSDDRRTKLQKLLTEEALQEFMDTTLFVNGKSPKQRNHSYKRAIIGLLRIKKIRTALELNASQNENLADLKHKLNEAADDEFPALLNDLLLPTQIERLHRVGIQNEAAKSGTANALSFGLLGKMLQLSEDDSKRLFEVATKINADLVAEIRQVEFESIGESLTMLSTEKREKVKRLIGDQVMILDAK